MVHSRIERVEELMREQVAKIIQEKLSDPRIGFTTITRVNVTKDLRHANIHLSFLNDDEESVRDALAALASAKGYIKREIAQTISLRYLPDLHFEHDPSAAYASHIQGILHTVEPEAGWVEPEDETDDGEEKATNEE